VREFFLTQIFARWRMDNLDSTLDLGPNLPSEIQFFLQCLAISIHGILSQENELVLMGSGPTMESVSPASGRAKIFTLWLMVLSGEKIDMEKV